eukprot:scaffold207_cov409-Prasinococcus_capsulatus_cf.AAC.67
MFVPYANMMLAVNTAAKVWPSCDTRRSASTFKDPGSALIAMGTSSSAAKLVVYLRRLGDDNFSVSPVSRMAASTAYIGTQLLLSHQPYNVRQLPTFNARSTVALRTAMNPITTKFNSPTEAIHAPPIVGIKAAYVYGDSIRP